ncbi:hypothetical protein SDC9_178660 [bioreactor metagenome]|uniref:2'-5' RNA ligase n=1 Tax=bioreactor metagenome TaxID=1076179 RepID=A0A645GY56_9ZZZZ
MHITFGIYPEAQKTELITKLQDTAREYAAFPVLFNHLGIFPGARVLFAAPVTNRPLLDLQSHFRNQPDWTAHTTLLIDQPAVIYQAIAALEPVFKTHAGKLTALHLYQLDPTMQILSVPLNDHESTVRNDLIQIIRQFAVSDWDLIAIPSLHWLTKADNKDELIKAVLQADRECGSCGCEYDALYKTFLAHAHLL